MLYIWFKQTDMALTKEEFEGFKSHQYCDNPACRFYGKVGEGNIKTHSVKGGQLYCNACDAGLFSIRKGTMFYDLRTPLDKIVGSLQLLTRGMGQNAVCREQGVTNGSLRRWIILASEQVNVFTEYMQRDMHLDQVQIDEFWSFIRKKKSI